MPHYSYPTYPDGALRTSIHDFSRIVRVYLNGGLFEETRNPEEETVDRILTPNRQKQGLIWYRTEGFMGHTGGDPGVRTYLFIDPEEKIGFFLFLNKEPGLLKEPAPNVMSMKVIEKFLSNGVRSTTY